MPFLIIILGVLFVVSGVQDTQSELMAVLKSDMTGYFKVAALILGLGSLGYIKSIKPITDAFIILIVIQLLLRNQGFFAKLQGYITNGTPSTCV